ncbi:MAG: hypothetical protein EA353_10105, partial [Puniceicoccaceae bacterium]
MIDRLLALLLLAGSALFTGCVNFKPTPDHTQIYVLAANVEPSADLTDKPRCYVGRVELPGFLEGSRILSRSASGTVVSAPRARWAEPPSEGLPRAIALHLQATGRAHVRAHYPWSTRDTELINISVQFERFSANAEGLIEVIAQWQIVGPDGAVQEGRYIAPQMHWDGLHVADYV